MRSGQQFASRLLQQLSAASKQTTRKDVASTSELLQSTAMRAAEARMQRLGLEVYWQPFDGSPGGGWAWDVAAGNATAGPADSAGSAAAAAASTASNEAEGGGGSSGGSARDAGAGICANLYGVLRSPRGDGKEGLVLATPLALAAPSGQRPGR